jgi:hypothetical protein
MTLFNKLLSKNSRLGILLNLLFFVPACNRQQEAGINIAWTNGKAKSVHISKNMIPGFSRDPASYLLKTTLEDDTTAILGEYTVNENIVFEPLFAFTPGNRYKLWYKDNLIGSFAVPAGDKISAPKLVAVYPQQDILPENLLKIYLQFSEPMREAVSAKHITLVKNGTDTIDAAFLDLQPELWNEDRTVITLWLDPGRIKRGLQPNLRLGAPLEKQAVYKLSVSGQWQSAKGMALQKEFIKTFITGIRDSLSPEINGWKIQAPKAGSKDSFIIEIPEPLDHFLLMESLHVTDKSGNQVKGNFSTDNNDMRCHFIPNEAWMAGNYQLVVESRLEDLAGNNLNRSFDRDVTKTKAPSTQSVYKRNFQVTN